MEITYQGRAAAKSINWYAPFYLYFMDHFCKLSKVFEGAPVVLWVGIILVLLGTICVVAYGSRLQGIVLMCLHYGIFSNFVRLLYAIGMVVNLVLQLAPMLETVESRQPSIFRHGTSPGEDQA